MGTLIKPVLAAASLAGMAPAWGQPDDAPGAPVDEITVTASGRKAQTETIPQAIAVIDLKTIRQTNTIRIGDLLVAVPGVSFSGLNGPREIVQIRQPLAFDNRTLFLEDGVPLQSSVFFDQSALAYSVALSAGTSVDVLRGPGTALYGSDAFAGVVNIRTGLEFDKDRAVLRARGGQFGLHDFTADVGIKAGAGQSVRLVGAFQGEDGFRDETAFNRRQAFARHALERPDFSLATTGTYSEYKTEPATAIPFDEFEAGSRASGLSPVIEPGTADENGSYTRIQTRLTLPVTRGIEIEFTPYLRRQKVSAAATFQPATVPRTDALVRTAGALLRGYITNEILGSIVIGLDAEFTEFSRFTFQAVPDTVVFGNLFRQGVQFDYDVDFRGLSPYAQWEKTFGQLTLSAGLRHDSIRYRLDNALAEVPGDARLQVADRTDRFDALSPKAGLVIDIGNGHSLFTRYARGFRIPRESDLYELSADQTDFDLTPETIDSVDFGWRYANRQLRTEILGYWAVSRDGILTDIQTAAGNISVNGGSSRFRGLEARLTTRLTEELDWTTSFAFQDFRFIERSQNPDDPFNGNLIPQSPRALAQTSLTYTPVWLPGFETALRLRHVGKWALNDANTLFTDNEFILSLFSDYRISDRLSINVRAENITDTRYPVFANAPAFAPGGRARPGNPRTISGGIEIEF